ncbi:hypothetical protein V6N13_132052 [Hibiscus sabdariffa]
MEIHHKGTLCFIDGENKYYDGEIDYFDWCNPTDLSLGYLNDCAQMLGYNEFITYHWRIPGNDLNDGLFKIEKDDDATIISLYVPDNRVVEIYFEHSSEFELARNVENSEDDCFIDSEYDLDDGDDGLVEIEVSSKIDMTSINESKERDKRKEKMIDTKPTRGSHDSLDNELASEFGYSSDVSDQLYLEYATSDNDSHFPRKRKHPEFDAGIDMKNPGFVVGMIFKDFDEFKNVCRQYSLVNQLGINFKHNDKDRVDVRCKEGCPFRIWASKMPDKMTVQIKSIVDEHSCSKIFENKFASVELLAYKFLDVFRDDPNMKVNTFLAKVRKELKLEIKWMKGYRTKVKALEILRGKDEDQYSKLPKYCGELRKRNPGSSTILHLDKSLFQSVYICINALKNGFLAGCRPIISVDGCWLKGKYGGHLLTAVGIDANDCIYPIAYAVVDRENRNNWGWFLNLLANDLNIENSHVWTFMSDRQKGLISIVQSLFPDSEHRFCVRHMYQNFVKISEHRGKALKDYLWAAARASYPGEFNYWMKKIEKISDSAYKWLKNKPAQEWSRSHFSTFSKCDMLLNNLCESFNSSIVDVRDKPILTMLEAINSKLMRRIYKRRDAMKRYNGSICPKIQKKLDKLKIESFNCIPDWSGGEHLEDYVDDCYKVTTFLKIYDYTINPIAGEDQWDFVQQGDAIIPPELLKSKRGRHQTKRRKDIVEIHEEKEKKNNLSKLSRKGLKMTCSICGQQGHNKRFHGVDNRLQESTQVGSFEPLENPLQDFVEDI